MLASTQWRLLTQKITEPSRLVVVFDGHAESVEKDEDDDEPIEPLRLDHAAYEEPAKRLEY
jgi:hypothetical protein